MVLSCAPVQAGSVQGQTPLCKDVKRSPQQISYARGSAMATMAIADYEDLEREVRQRLERQDHAGAATLAIRRLGPEIFGFLVSIHRTEEDAAEVFSLFTERLWRGLGTYQGDCSVRTFAYVIARHASVNHRRDENRRQKRLRPLTATSEPAALAAAIRSETASYLRTDRRSRFAELRQSLSVEDQTLLILRVDRGLSWTDLATVLRDASGSELPLAAHELVREAARLRKRFQLVKERLLVLGRQAGVVTVEED